MSNATDNNESNTFLKSVMICFNVPADLDTPSEVKGKIHELLLIALEAYKPLNKENADLKAALLG